jgi:hypothetical protein
MDLQQSHGPRPRVVACHLTWGYAPEFALRCNASSRPVQCRDTRDVGLQRGKQDLMRQQCHAGCCIATCKPQAEHVPWSGGRGASTPTAAHNPVNHHSLNANFVGLHTNDIP